MERKFLLITIFVILAVIGSIETKRSSGGRRPSSGSSHRNTGSSSNRHTSTHHATNTHNTGSFLNSERGHSSSLSGNYNKNYSPIRPFSPIPSPPKHTNTGVHNSPLRPFSPIPSPPKHTITGNHNSPTRPFSPVPSITTHNSGSNNNNRNPQYKPFPTVPPRITVTPKPPPPPPGFILPSTVSNTHNNRPPITHPGANHPPTVNRPGSHINSHNGSTGFSRPSPGFNTNTNYPRPPPYNPSVLATTKRPGTTHINHRNISTIGSHPSAPGFNTSLNYPRPPAYNPIVHPGIPQTNYPVQQGNPGSGIGINQGAHYPKQPAYNPAYPNIPPPIYTQHPQQPAYNPAYPNMPPPIYTQHPSQPGYVQNPVHSYPQYANVHSLPPNPALHTVVIVPGQSSSYNGWHRSTGDIFKEAIIHAGVRATVDRIVSPNHYHGYHGSSSWNNYGTPNSQGQNTMTTTNTHIINNNNYYGETPITGSNIPPIMNGQPSNNPSSGLPIGSTNVPSVNSGSQGSAPGTIVPTNGHSYNNGNVMKQEQSEIIIWDQELLNITEKLYNLDENNATKFISLNLQKQFINLNNTNITDESPQPLLTVQPEAYNIPTIRAIRSLYEANIEIENKRRDNSRKEEALFIDMILNTNVMMSAMNFLSEKKIISNDYYEHKDMLKHLWFTTYDGHSSGFKRIFQGEIWKDILWGVQDWIAFDFNEKLGRANYFGWINKTELGKSSPNSVILKTNFEMNGFLKAGTSLFIGISPELQIALYTICHYTRPNNYCDISLGGTKFKIYTHMDRYFGKDLINVAFPIT